MHIGKMLTPQEEIERTQEEELIVNHLPGEPDERNTDVAPIILFFSLKLRLSLRWASYSFARVG